MVETRVDLISAVECYASELERLGVPVERIILYGSRSGSQVQGDSDIDLAVFSEAFGPPDHLEFSGVLSKATWATEPAIEAIGYHPSELGHVNPISFVHEIVSTGEVVYRRTPSAGGPVPAGAKAAAV